MRWIGLTLWALAACSVFHQASVSAQDGGEIEARQAQLAEQYRLLEAKLFSLHQVERQQNPDRSRLLLGAFERSQQQQTLQQMEQVAQLLGREQLADAQSVQEQLLKDLEELLQLLAVEGREQRIRSTIERNQEYLREVDELLRQQQAIRRQAMQGAADESLEQSQRDASRQTSQLADRVREDELAESGAAGDESQGTPDLDGENQAPAGEPDDASPADDPPAGDGQPDHAESGREGDPPLAARLRAAQQRMRAAQQRLSEAQRQQSIEEMQRAERELAAAKRQLEEILRQLREEEVERTLLQLEQRFRQMLERQVRVLESTLQLDQVPTVQRDPEFDIRAGRLAAEQRGLATEAESALQLLHEDGSTAAFPVTVQQVCDDMHAAAQRLRQSQVDGDTQRIQQDVIDTLELLVSAFVQAQNDQARRRQDGSDTDSDQQPGDMSLVDQLAELRMIRAMQQRIRDAHQRWWREGQFNLPLDTAHDSAARQALQRLADRQRDLQRITENIVLERNR